MTVDSVCALKATLLDYLRPLPAFRQAKLLEEFPAGAREYPLRVPTLAVGIDGVEASSGGLGGYWGEEETGAASIYGKALTLTLRFDLLCDPGKGGSACHLLWEALCAALMLEQCPLPFQRLWCGQLEYDKALSLNRLTARGTLRALLSRGDSSMLIERFEVKKM